MTVGSDKLRLLRRIPLVQFDEDIRGYSKSQVDRVLETLAPLADEIEALQAQLQEATERADLAAAQAGGTASAPHAGPDGDFDQTLRNTLLLAQRTADQTVREAEAKAEEIRRDSTAKADSIKAGARTEAKELKGEAHAQREQMLADAESERAQLLAEALDHAESRKQSIEEELMAEQGLKRNELLSEIGELERTRDDLSADVVRFEDFIRDRRAGVRSALGEITAVLDDPELLAEQEAPDPQEIGLLEPEDLTEVAVDSYTITTLQTEVEAAQHQADEMAVIASEAKESESEFSFDLDADYGTDAPAESSEALPAAADSESARFDDEPAAANSGYVAADFEPASFDGDDASESADDASESADYASESADYASESADDASRSVEYGSESADYASESADDASRSVEYGSVSADYASESADYGSESADYVSESAGDVSESADYGSVSADYGSVSAAYASGYVAADDEPAATEFEPQATGYSGDAHAPPSFLQEAGTEVEEELPQTFHSDFDSDLASPAEPVDPFATAGFNAEAAADMGEAEYVEVPVVPSVSSDSVFSSVPETSDPSAYSEIAAEVSDPAGLGIGVESPYAEVEVDAGRPAMSGLAEQARSRLASRVSRIRDSAVPQGEAIHSELDTPPPPSADAPVTFAAQPPAPVMEATPGSFDPPPPQPGSPFASGGPLVGNEALPPTGEEESWDRRDGRPLHPDARIDDLPPDDPFLDELRQMTGGEQPAEDETLNRFLTENPESEEGGGWFNRRR